MDQLCAPRWTSQLVHGDQALAAWLEKLRALSRLGWADIQPLERGGFSLSLSAQSLPALQSWLANFPSPERLFRVAAYKLDDFGNYFIILNPKETSSTVRQQAVICGWSDRPKAVEFLRSTSPGQDSFIHAWQIVAALKIAEVPLNALDLPASCKTDSGQLLRLNEQKAEEALTYLCVDRPSDCSVPLVVKLSPNDGRRLRLGSIRHRTVACRPGRLLGPRHCGS